MAVMAQWLNKTWEVSARKITALTSIQTGLSLETETNDDADGEAATNIRGYQLRTLPLAVKYGVAAGTPDPRAEYESWEALVGAYAPFYLAGRRLGAKKYLLTSVKATDVDLSTAGSTAGRWIECTVSLTLEEYAAEASGDKGTVTGSSLSSAVAISSAAAIAGAASAAKVGASASDKATRKVASL